LHIGALKAKNISVGGVLLFMLLSPGSKALGEEKKTSPLSFIKNIQIGDATVSCGGDFRLRYEYRKNFDFDYRSDNNDGLWYLRTRLHMGGSIAKNVTFFLEGLDAREWKSDKHPRKQEDTFDFHQGYVIFSNAGSKPFVLKFGRQKLKYGAKRLVGAPIWANKIRSFDAIRVSYSPVDFDVETFVANRVRYQSGFNSTIWGENFFGIYATYKGVARTVFDFYNLNMVDKRHHVEAEDGTFGDLERYTIGHRGEGNFGETPFGWGYELAYQFGDKGSDDIDAHAYHLDVHYRFTDRCWQPKLSLEYNFATGDKDPNDGDSETFVPLFQSVHGPYGTLDLFRWQNVKHYGVMVDLSPVKHRLYCSVQYQWFYLDETADAWYNTKGKVIRRDPTGEADDYVGDELDVVIRYVVNKRITLEGGYAHFFAKDYVEDTGSGDDCDWFYAQTVVSF
jgi:hypothetical protein